MAYSIRRPLSNTEQKGLAGFSPLLSHLLFHRGIEDTETAAKFLAPDYERDTHNPLFLKDAEKAAARIIRAISNDERIAIYADYDADGIPGAVIWHDFFARIGFKNFSIYIPHRHDEGFGLNNEAVEQLAGEGVKLLVTVDCGIADAVAVARASELQMDVIITDHHEPASMLPAAFAIVDHKQIDCEYPDKNLCGAAVAYKLILAVLAKDRLGLKEGHEKWLLDMVGLATLSDMVPLTGENRVFAHYGLAVLRKSPRKGLVQLFSKLGISQRHVTEDDIAFMITPRINAASRMGVPMDAFHLLTARNNDEASKYAEHLDHINNERKGVVASLVKEIKKTIKERYGIFINDPLPNVIVLGNPLWRPSLLGLAANSCAEEFNRPVFLWGRDGDSVIKGSCRSEGRSNVVEIMRFVSTGVFSQFGGHQHSGGFAVYDEQIHFLEQRLNEAYNKILDSRLRGNDKTESDGEMIDAALTLDEVGPRLYSDIDKLSPFGKGNPKPVFLFKGIAPASVRRFGKANDHLELVFKGKDGANISAISFFGAESEWAKSLAAGQVIDLVASVEKSRYRGREELRLRVVDVICR